VQMLDVVAKYPAFAQALTIEDGTNMLNSVSRNLGLSVKFRVPEGVDPKQPIAPGAQEQVQSAIQQLSQAVQEIAGAQQQQQSDTQALAEAVGKLAGAITAQKNPTPQGAVSDTIPRGAPPMNPAMAQDVMLGQAMDPMAAAS
jgi:hypothetical protein